MTVGVHLDPAGMTRREIYNLLHGCVVPRPIAWVTSLSPEGRVNAAPFSLFTIVSVLPPMVLFSCGIRNGRRKDTARNVAEHGEFCVNVVSRALLETMHSTSAEFPSDVSEPEALCIPLEPSSRIAVPRIANSPASFECVLRHVLKFGQEDETFVGEVVGARLHDGLWEGAHVDQAALDAVGRIGGPTYVTAGEFIHAAQPRL